jgi:tetrahydromethanopterin S-methyltransferase subunit G
MSFLDQLVENVLPAVISGGGTAASAIIAFFRDIKKRLEETEKKLHLIETKIGSVEAKSGIVYTLFIVEEAAKKLRGEMDAIFQNGHPHTDWAHLPWAARRALSSLNLEELHEAVAKMRTLETRLRETEESLDRIERLVNKCVTEEDFDQATRQNNEDVLALRTAVAEANGLLKGLQSVLSLDGAPKGPRR